MKTEALESVRKESQALLTLKGYTINPNLPLLDRSNGLKDVTAIAHRINILHIFYAIQLEGKPSIPFFQQMIQEKGWEEHLSRKEAAFLQETSWNAPLAIDFSWYKECIVALLWSCCNAENINDLEEVDLADYYPRIPPEMDFSPFLKSLSLRAVVDIFKALDYYYNLHWTCKSSMNKSAIAQLSNLFKRKDSISLNESIIRSRRKALEWVLYKELDWDCIVLDT